MRNESITKFNAKTVLTILAIVFGLMIGFQTAVRAQLVRAAATGATRDGLSRNNSISADVHSFAFTDPASILLTMPTASGVSRSIFLQSSPSAPTTNFASVQSGNWNDPATWGGAGIPGAPDNVTITTTGSISAVRRSASWSAMPRRWS